MMMHPLTPEWRMRGSSEKPQVLFSYVALEDRVPKSHPLRAIRRLVDPVLAQLSPRFDAMYSTTGRPSIPPEQLLRALLLQVLYTVRSERMLMEQLDYNLLFRWFVGLSLDDRVWDPTVFTKNRDRLLTGDIAQAFFAAVVADARQRRLLSDEHFTVDGTLLDAWASHKSFRPKDEPPQGGGAGRNAEVDFEGKKRSNETHQSVTDPDARLARKGGEASRLCYCANALMDNRHGLIVDTEVLPASGTAEWEAGVRMLERQAAQGRTGTIGADKGYDAHRFVTPAEALGFRAHVARKRRQSVIDEALAADPGYMVSQRKRKLVEEGFGWDKTVGLLRKLRHRGTALVGWVFAFTSAAYNLVRMRSLIEAGVCP